MLQEVTLKLEPRCIAVLVALVAALPASRAFESAQFR
jgi:hypothetical protein